MQLKIVVHFDYLSKRNGDYDNAHYVSRFAGA